jgi:hypothetical protein
VIFVPFVANFFICGIPAPAYSDMSSRVMATLAADGYPQEIYSIDECFLGVGEDPDPLAWAHATRARVLREVGSRPLHRLAGGGEEAGGGVCRRSRGR